jgi:two-component system response regulator CpxR
MLRDVRALMSASLPITILVADDDIHVRAALSALLSEEGYEVLTAGDGREAIRLAKRHAPDAMLLDIEMPLANGFEVLSEIKSDPSTKSIPVVMLTGRGDSQARNMTAELGASGFIQKPWNDGEIERSMAAVLRSAGKLPAEAN